MERVEVLRVVAVAWYKSRTFRKEVLLPFMVRLFNNESGGSETLRSLAVFLWDQISSHVIRLKSI